MLGKGVSWLATRCSHSKLIICTEKLSRAFLQEGALEKLCSLLSIADQPSEVVRYGLLALSALVEIGETVGGWNLSMKLTYTCI